MIKTLAELEAESSDGFKNPEISDKEFNDKLERMKIKSDAENTPDRIQSEPDEENNED